MSVPVTNDKVSRAAVARVLRPLIVEAGSLRTFASEAASGSSRTLAYWERTLRKWLGSAERTQNTVERKGKRYVQGTVGYDRVDELLTAVGMGDLWYGPELRRWGLARTNGTQPRRYKKRRSESKMTLDDLREAHRRHLDGESLRGLGRSLWQQYGYASPAACANSISEAFLREGMATRDRIEAVKIACVTHGNASRDDRRKNTLRFRVHRKRIRRARGEVRGVKCAGMTRNLHPCRNYAQAGKSFCIAHDPDRRDEVLGYINKLRTLRGLDAVADA